ncbi:MAG: hypothetical protein ACYS22_15135 [Planctomycetota bacterium]
MTRFDIGRRFQVEELALYGSILRGDFGSRAPLRCKVDLVVEAALRNPFRRASILESKQRICAA